MCICEFCNTSFQPRAQVKRPRACPKCQKKRQRDNEEAWRKRHPEFWDKQYHQIKKAMRLKRLGEIMEIVLHCLKVGKEFLNQSFDLEMTRAFLSQFLEYVGIREINKFWKFP